MPTPPWHSSQISPCYNNYHIFIFCYYTTYWQRKIVYTTNAFKLLNFLPFKKVLNFLQIESLFIFYPHMMAQLLDDYYTYNYLCVFKNYTYIIYWHLSTCKPYSVCHHAITRYVVTHYTPPPWYAISLAPLFSCFSCSNPLFPIYITIVNI